MRHDPVYAELVARMRAGTDDELVADLTRFVGSFADHDNECPGYNAIGREAELDTCTCGFARRYDLLDEVQRRLVRA